MLSLGLIKGNLRRKPAESAQSFPGVFGHAQVVAQLLDGRSRPDAGPVGRLAMILLAALIGMALGLWRGPVIVTMLAALALPVLWLLGVFYLVREFGLMLPAAAPVFALWLALAAFALIRARRAEKTRKTRA